VLTERPADAVAEFEQLSAAVKQQKTINANDLEAQSKLLKDIAQLEPLKGYSRRISQLFGIELEPHEGDDDVENVDQEPLAAPKASVLADLNADNQSWRAAGICIAEADLFKLQLSLARLAGSDGSIKSLRLWGNLFGRQASYFVAEGSRTNPTHSEDENAEPEANQLTYWVATFPGAAWKQLPAVTSEAVQVAGKIRRFLTGDLTASVIGYPKFPGKEDVYVRAIIALINADCALAPAGYFVASEEGEDVVPCEEFSFPSSSELCDPAAGWQAYGTAFNSLGKVKPIEKEDDEGNTTTEPEGWEFQPLRDVESSLWTARTTPFSLPELKSEHVVLRSRLWEGAHVMASPASKTWTNFYCGFGFKKLEGAYVPPMPPAMQKEFPDHLLREEPDIIEDPNPSEEIKQGDEEATD